MSPSPPYVGSAQWVRCPTGWTLTFDPPLVVKAHSRIDTKMPLPPELGGPAGWFPIVIEYQPLDAPQPRVSGRFKRRLFDWVVKTKELLKEVQDSGLIVNASDGPASATAARSHALAGAAIELTRSMMLFMALADGADVAALDATLHRDFERAYDERQAGGRDVP